MFLAICAGVYFLSSAALRYQSSFQPRRVDRFQLMPLISLTPSEYSTILSTVEAEVSCRIHLAQTVHFSIELHAVQEK